MKFENVKNIEIGIGVFIHPTAEIFDLEYLSIGDHSYIGPGVKITGGGRVTIGDYSKIHDRVFIFAKKEVRLGHIAWVASNCHLDGTGEFIAGNFLGIGHNSVLYTHMRHGDELEGYRMAQDSALIIGDDVCFSGTCFVCPVKVEDKAMALVGAVVTKPMKENRVYAGNPAVDISDKLGRVPYINVDPETKINNLKHNIAEYKKNINSNFELDSIAIVEDFPSVMDSDITYYNITTREYTKRNTSIEVGLNKWLFGFKAKFKPLD